MSLLKLSMDLPPNATFVPLSQAHFLSQILPAYKNHMIEADEIYHLAVYKAPISTCRPWVSIFRGEDRIMGLR